MRVQIIVLACLACMDYGRELKSAGQGSPHEEHQNSRTPIGTQELQAQGHARQLRSLKVLASLLLACDPAAAWQGNLARMPSVFRRTPQTQASATASDLIVVGAGVLGRLVAQQWQELHGAGSVTGVTRELDAKRAAELQGEGILPRARIDLDIDSDATPSTRYSYVLFCANPMGNDDYAGEVAKALKLWDASKGGRFVFTSSAGVYDDGVGLVTETSAVGDSERAKKLVAAEALVTAAGGTVVRLAGLYKLDRGAHNFWWNKGQVNQPPDGFVNQIHYEDAASLAVAALLRSSGGTTFLGADDAPLSRLEISDQTARLPQFATKGCPVFTGSPTGNPGKRLDNSWTRDTLQWSPRYSTFRAFVDAMLEG